MEVVSTSQMFERFIAKAEEVHTRYNAKNIFDVPVTAESPRK
jgi:hypothetical protein